MRAKIKSQADHSREVLQKHIPLTTPWVIYIEPSGYCNLRCNFCPQTTGKMKKDNMSLELFKQGIDQIKEFKNPIKMLRVCGNGEPLLNPQIVEMLEYANASKVFEKIELVTNGIRLNEDLAKKLPLYCNRIIVSIEGLSGSDYEAMAGKSINFIDLVRNIVILYQNRSNCKIMVKIANEAVKIESKQKLFYQLFGNICNEIYIENLVPMWPGLESMYKLKSRWQDVEATKRQVCVQIFKGIQIQANGDVVPCCVDWERVNLLGNIKNTRLTKIWHSDKLKKLQLTHLKGKKNTFKPCQDCTMNDSCDPDNIDNDRLDLLRKLT
jgi:radical SAM protein with 4Fe4S-binding SPASM domain